MDLKVSPVFLAILASITLLLSHLSVRTILATPEALTNWLLSFGPYVLIIYIIAQTITIVIPPLGGGLFLFIAVIAIFGPVWGLLLLYLIPVPLYCVNFYLARQFGRPIVAKLIGEKGLIKFDEYAKGVGAVTLTILRIGGPFDYLSYIVGLTKFPFKTFLMVNVLGGIPGTVLSYFVLKSFPNQALGIIAVILTTYLIVALSLLLNHLIKRHW